MPQLLHNQLLPGELPVTPAISANLRAFRQLRGRTHFDFQVDNVCSPSTINNLENRKRPTCNTYVLRKIAKYLDTDLLTLQDENAIIA